ncbi:hypothetical protein HPB50_024145 [Hyalomma asiaticum]|uniref:Uncharacterized protein n=1 Tax=Hyalomma asiaticum TaxID=266040 RepID=A0ACB7TPY9_HYAAI|nr:hypothetical protein HPB50_024145 [Hyalomma asiaticum]
MHPTARKTVGRAGRPSSVLRNVRFFRHRLIVRVAGITVYIQSAASPSSALRRRALLHVRVVIAPVSREPPARRPKVGRVLHEFGPRAKGASAGGRSAGDQRGPTTPRLFSPRLRTCSRDTRRRPRKRARSPLVEAEASSFLRLSSRGPDDITPSGGRHTAKTRGGEPKPEDCWSTRAAETRPTWKAEEVAGRKRAAGDAYGMVAHPAGPV